MRKITKFFDDEYHLTASELMEITGVCQRTARRWILGQQKIHPAYKVLIELHQEGRILPADSGCMVTDDHQGIINQEINQADLRAVMGFGEIRALFYTREMHERTKIENKLLTAQVEKLQAQAQATAAQDNQAPSQLVVENPLARPQAANQAI